MIQHFNTKEFACMAEARAYYLNQGYKTSDETADSYLMVKFNPVCTEVLIEKEGFLKVVAKEYRV